MGFEETFTDFLLEDEGNNNDLNKNYHPFEYTNLKNHLNICKHHKHNETSINSHGDRNDLNQILLPHQACDGCDWMFNELTTEASKMADYISLKVKQLVRLHFTPSMPRFLSCLFQCFKDDKETLVHDGLMLIQFVVMNAIAVRKILKKYDKVHQSTNGINVKSELQAKHLDIIQSPWLIELVAFYMNLNGSDSLMSDGLFGSLSFDLNITDEGSILTLTILGSEILEYNFTCPICLDIVFQPYALSCGHIFCKSCACLAARVLIIQGFKYASSESKCPVCRESGVYAKSVCLSELGLLLQLRYKEGFKERLIEERKRILNQTKEYWELQTSFVMGL